MSMKHHGSFGTAPTVCYQIITYTSDIANAGTTSSTVHITMEGPHGSSGELKLQAGSCSGSGFGRGETSTFLVQSPNVGPVVSVTVRTSGGLLNNSKWHLDKLEVLNTANGLKNVFPCGQWLKGKTEVTLKSNVLEASHSAVLTEYRITVYTSNLNGAGTDAKVWIEIYGAQLFIERQQLGGHPEEFEAGSRDEFIIHGLDVGDITHIRVGHDNAGYGAAWHLDKVEIYHGTAHKLYTFWCREWLREDKVHGVAGCERTLYPGTNPPPLVRTVTGSEDTMMKQVDNFWLKMKTLSMN